MIAKNLSTNDSSIQDLFNRSLDDSGVDNTQTLLAPGKFVEVVNVVVGVVGIVTTLFHMTTLNMVARCRIMPFQVKYLSVSLLLSEALSGSSLFTHQLLINMFKIVRPLLLNTRLLACMVFASVSIAFIACLAVERALALCLNLRYSVSLTKKKVIIVILVVWVSNLLAVVMVTAFGSSGNCTVVSDPSPSCDRFESTRKARVLLMVLISTYLFIIIVSYRIISHIVARHVRQIRTTNTSNNVSDITGRQFKSTTAIMNLVVANIMLFLPFILHGFIFELLPEHRETNWRRFLHLLAYLSIEMGSLLNMILYIWKFKECRLQFMLVFLRCCLGDRCRRKTEALRNEVYNIVISSE